VQVEISNAFLSKLQSGMDVYILFFFRKDNFEI